jgi:nucleotide-binding universal stress UspA family protein
VRHVLIAVSGALVAEALGRVLRQLDWSDAEVSLLHVVDTRPLSEFRLAAGRLAGRAGQAAGRLREMGAKGAEASQRMLEEAEALAVSRLPPATVIRRLQRTGIPEHEIIAAAYDTGADLIVLGAAEDPAGPPPPPPHPERRPPPQHAPPPPGAAEAPRVPHRHLSPTVRFVVDHAPCDVLLVYAGHRP